MSRPRCPSLPSPPSRAMRMRAALPTPSAGFVALFATVLTAALLAACSAPEPSTEADVASPEDSTARLAGDWRAVLASPGGELPFTLRLTADGAGLNAIALNGAEKTPIGPVEQDGSQVVLRFPWYDSEISAELDSEGTTLTGRWRKTVPEGDSVLDFRATRSDTQRFLELADVGLEPGPGAAQHPSIAGHWTVVFTDEDGTEPARGEFIQSPDGRVDGTFLTPTGDYRFLEGTYGDGILRLSTFDGAHAFLFQATMAADGTLSGDFWSRDTYHATWTASPVGPEEAILPDSWELVGLTNAEGRFRFEFPDLDGNAVSLDDPRFEGKVVLVNIFGSWCPNCNDEAPILAEWAKRYRGQGLEVVGLAYEFSGDPERDGHQVELFAERYGIDYTLLLAGTSDKADAAATLPDLTAVIAYPTSIFLDREGKVRKIHTGFSGPGTGEHHTRLVNELEEVIEQLLAEG